MKKILSILLLFSFYQGFAQNQPIVSVSLNSTADSLKIGISQFTYIFPYKPQGAFSGFTKGQVVVWGSNSVLQGYNTFFRDSSTGNIGIGTNAPTRPLTFDSSHTVGITIFNSVDQVTNTNSTGIGYSGNTMQIKVNGTGTNTTPANFLILNTNTTFTPVFSLFGGNNNQSGIFQFKDTVTSNQGAFVFKSFVKGNSSANTGNILTAYATNNTTGTNNFILIYGRAKDSTHGSGSFDLLNLGMNGAVSTNTGTDTVMARINRNGNLTLAGNITATLAAGATTDSLLTYNATTKLFGYLNTNRFAAATGATGYIFNQSTQQAGSSFNISGTGKATVLNATNSTDNQLVIGNVTGTGSATLGYADANTANVLQQLQPVAGTYPISSAGQDITAQSAVGNIATYTTTAIGSYRIGGYVAITAIATDVLQLEVTWTDENSTSQTQLFYPLGLTSSNLSTTGFYAFPTCDIRVKTGTVITVKTILAVGAGSVTFDAGATIMSLR